jgi:mono/diheme cytochrome c family protein
MLLIGAILTLHERIGRTDDITFTAGFLQDEANIALGKQLWVKRCKFCHGTDTHPGSASPLQPWRYQPEFIYDRITNGFRAMPALKEDVSLEERKAIVAYVLSQKFSP